ncbi:MAG: ATP-binding cassette domain-containing protein [Candidatus Onthovivens sp.]|nr:ATP-binding cassette domain-containing protein [Candidatus Onthovivens sp.]
MNEIVTRERANIRRAKYDNANYQKNFAKKHIDETKSLFLPKLKEAKKQLSFNFESIKNYISLFLEYRGALRIAKRQTVMSKMQMIFQDPIASLDPRMTVRDIIAEGLKIRGVKNSKIIDEEVKKALNEVGLLPEHASRFPHEFSGGQRQRIGIARALVMKPDLIIADEPISALDVSIQAQVINLLNELKEKHNLTILFIAHDLSVVKYFCDRIAVMYFGNLVELASSDELFKHPIHPYTKSLLSAIPLPDPHYEKNRKRIEYNPKLFHEYDGDKPSLREVSPNHFVRCNQKEYDRIIEELK